MSLNKHQIFASNDLKEEFVDMPEWGGKVKIKVLSVKEQLDFDLYLSSKPLEVDLSIYLITLACVDDNNNKLFDKEDDIDLLKSKNMKSIVKLVNAILSLNKQDENAFENAQKN